MIPKSQEFLVDVYRELADKYHNKIKRQVRKYSGLPYTVHTDEVESIVREVEPQNFIARAAAHGHDIYEDVLTHLSPDEFKKELTGNFVDLFPQLDEINNVIIELSNVFTSEKYPNLNRAAREKLERERLANVSPTAQTVKLADVLCNSKDIAVQDPKFAKVYLKEKAALVPLLTKGNRILFDRAMEFLKLTN